MRALVALALALVLGCDGSDEDDGELERRGDGVRARSDGKPAVPDDRAPWGVEALDALSTVDVNGTSALVSIDTDAVVARAGELAPLFERAARIDARALPLRARVALQNDAWGFVERLRASSVTSEPHDALARAGIALVRTLAFTEPELASLDGAEVPEALARLLPASEGWREVDTEHSVLGHERAFGLRRLFRLFVAPGRRALASQLVALDARGGAHLTSVVGEIEVLRFDGALPVEARVHHLDRGALGGAEQRLVSVDAIDHIPSLGADRFLLSLEAPEPLATMPCARCHEDDDAFSLPTGEPPRPERHTRLLEQATGAWRSAASD
jgi:hypothetical protein